MKKKIDVNMRVMDIYQTLQLRGLGLKKGRKRYTVDP